MRKPAIDRARLGAHGPSIDRRCPPRAAARCPRRRCADRDRRAPITTRATPAATSRSAQAGPRARRVRAGLERDVGVAPRAASPASASAIASACGRPPGWVQPRPTTRPSSTMTQPTLGLGAVRPRPRSASASAARHPARVGSEAPCLQLVVDLLELLRRCFSRLAARPRSAPSCHVGPSCADLGVGAVGGQLST